MRVLIAGCGYLGAEVARRLVARGDEVLALRRSDAPPPDGARAVRADLADPASLASAVPAGLDGVVYAAAPGAREDAAYRRAYVDGVGHLAERVAAGSPGLRRFLLVGSTAVYAQQGGAWVDEDSPTEPTHFSGRRLLEGEARLLATGLPATVLRLGGLYGPGRTSLLRRVATGEARLRPGPPRHTNRIHRDDAAAALVHLLDADDAPSLLLGVDDDPAPEPAVFAWMAERLGVALQEAEVETEEPPTGRRALGNKRCRNARLRATGFALAYPSFREGYAALLAEAGGPAAFGVPSAQEVPR